MSNALAVILIVFGSVIVSTIFATILNHLGVHVAYIHGCSWILGYATGILIAEVTF